MTDYSEINAMLASIIEGIPYTMTNLANASALLNEKLDGINWVGLRTPSPARGMPSTAGRRRRPGRWRMPTGRWATT